MGLVERLRTPEGRSGLVAVDAAALLHGAVRTSAEGGGWVRPWRLTAAQVRAVSSCMAWHPGLYRQMAACTAGVWVELDTDADEVALEVALDEESHGTAASLALVDGDGPREAHDGVSAESSRRHSGPVLPVAVGEGPEATSVVAVDVAALAGPGEREGMVALPGMGALRRVRIFLPCLRGCAVRSLVAPEGSRVEPVPARPVLLVLGDSLAQGFVAGDPALAWPTLVADALGMDVVNQGIGGQVVQPGSILDLPAAVSPARVVVEYGGNYRYEPCRAGVVRRDVRSYLGEVARLWPDAPCLAMSTTWFVEERWPTHPRSCFAEVAGIMREEAARAGMGFVDGMSLMDHDAALLADGLEHPGEEGNRQIARRLVRRIRRDARARREARPGAAAESRPAERAPEGVVPLPLDLDGAGGGAAGT